MASAAQIRMLGAARRQLGLDDDAWRAMLRRLFGKTSATELDTFEVGVVVAELEQAGFRNTSQGRTFGWRPGFATDAQAARIRKEWAIFAGEDASPATLDRWLERTFHVSALRFLPFDKARKAIEGLKAMNTRRGGQDAAATTTRSAAAQGQPAA